MPKETWTTNEINILKTHYPTTRCKQMLELLPNHSQEAIKRKANRLDVHKERLADGYSLNENIFDNWSIESAYLFGYISADGCLKHYGNNGYFLQFTIKETDKQYLEQVRQLFQFSGKLRYESTGYGKHRYVLTIGSKKIYYRLSELGLSKNKTYNLQLPETLPENLYQPYLRGFTDGDGTISYHKRPKYYLLLCKLGCATKSYIENIREIICNELNIPKPTITKKKNKQFYVFSLSGQKAKRYLDWIYDCPLFIKLERKYQRYLLFDEKGQSKIQPPKF